MTLQQIKKDISDALIKYFELEDDEDTKETLEYNDGALWETEMAESLYEALESYSKKVTLESASGTLELEDSWGGEGEGDSYGYVFSLSTEETKRFFEFDGYYSSCDGHSFDGAELYEVVPRMVEVRKWFPAK